MARYFSTVRIRGIDLKVGDMLDVASDMTFYEVLSITPAGRFHIDVEYEVTPHGEPSIMELGVGRYVIVRRVRTGPGPYDEPDPERETAPKPKRNKLRRVRIRSN